MTLTPGSGPAVKGTIIQPYQGGDAFALEDHSLAPADQEVKAQLLPKNGPPLEVLAASDNAPDAPLSTRKDELVFAPSSNVTALSLATQADAPKLATAPEMKEFIERVRALRSMNPKSPHDLTGAFEKGLDILNRTERARLSLGLVSPAAAAESLYELADRAAKNLKALGDGAILIYQKPSQELAQIFISHVTKLLANRNVSPQDPYLAGTIAEVVEEAYYTMILDSTHLSQVDVERLHGTREAKKTEEPVVERKLTIAEKRARMGLPVRKQDQQEPGSQEPISEPVTSETKPETAGEEYEKELVATERGDFAGLIERVKPNQAENKFKLYGKLSSPPPATMAKDGNSLLAAYAAMSDQAANYSNPQQAHVYSVADTMASWCKAELSLLVALKKDLTAANWIVTLENSAARAIKLKERMERYQQAEKQNGDAVRSKLVEIARLITAEPELMASVKTSWRKEMTALLGAGKVLHDEVVVNPDVWRDTTAARHARDTAIIEEQVRLSRKLE